MKNYFGKEKHVLNMSSQSRFSTLVTAASLISAMVWFGLFAFPLPWKVTDPSAAGFNAVAFRFTDYPNRLTLEPAVKAIIPIGTAKAKVDAIMQNAGARVRPYRTATNSTNTKHLFYYEYSNWRSYIMDGIYLTPAGDNAWKVGVYYDSSDCAQKIVVVNP